MAQGIKLSLGADKRLKSKKEIEFLFAKGTSVSNGSILIKYHPSISGNGLNKAVFTVSKRFFKKAVDRNYLKRMMKESYRKNQYLISYQNLNFAFVYIGKSIEKQSIIENSIKSILEIIQHRLSEKI
jgi:ribonuclease P protein component